MDGSAVEVINIQMTHRTLNLPMYAICITTSNGGLSPSTKMNLTIGKLSHSHLNFSITNHIVLAIWSAECTILSFSI